MFKEKIGDWQETLDTKRREAFLPTKELRLGALQASRLKQKCLLRMLRLKKSSFYY
jgi:hypothetical protein